MGYRNSTDSPAELDFPIGKTTEEMIADIVEEKHKEGLESKVLRNAQIKDDDRDERTKKIERAKSSLSRGYSVKKHCGGLSRPHDTFIILAGDELTWKRKGSGFASIELKDITEIKTEGKKVTIKSKGRDLGIDIASEEDREEFVDSLNELIKI